MFRRFMIVCWILFGLSVLLSGIGWAGSAYYGSELEAVKASLYDHVAASDSRSVQLLADEIRSSSDKISESIRARAFAELERREKTRALQQERSVLRDKHEVSIELGFVALIAVGLLLSWNIVCHTMHWVWQGRERRLLDVSDRPRE